MRRRYLLTPFLAPLREELCLSFFPRPLPLFLPPPASSLMLLTNYATRAPPRYMTVSRLICYRFYFPNLFLRTLAPCLRPPENMGDVTQRCSGTKQLRAFAVQETYTRRRNW